MNNQETCVKCIICQRAAASALEDIGALFAAGAFPHPADREAVIAALNEAERAAEAARECLLQCLGRAA